MLQDLLIVITKYLRIFNNQLLLSTKIINYNLYFNKSYLQRCEYQFRNYINSDRLVFHFVNILQNINKYDLYKCCFNLDLVKLIINKHPNLIEDSLCYNHENLEVVKYLVSVGADIQRNDNYLIKSLSWNGNLEIIKYLASIGTDICFNNYAISRASENGHLEVVKYLVSIGADIYANDNYAIRYANKNGHLQIVKYLVSIGANIPKKIKNSLHGEVIYLA